MNVTAGELGSLRKDIKALEMRIGELKWTRNEKIVELSEKGYSNGAIADIVGLHEGRIRQIIREMP